MLIQDVIVEASIADSKACEFARVAITVSATLNRGLDQSMLKQLLIEKLGVATKITDKVADLCSNTSIWVLNQHVQISIYVGIMDGFIEVLADSCQLRDEAQAIDDQVY